MYFEIENAHKLRAFLCRMASGQGVGMFRGCPSPVLGMGGDKLGL